MPPKQSIKNKIVTNKENLNETNLKFGDNITDHPDISDEDNNKIKELINQFDIYYNELSNINYKIKNVSDNIEEIYKKYNIIPSLIKINNVKSTISENKIQKNIIETETLSNNIDNSIEENEIKTKKTNIKTRKTNMKSTIIKNNKQDNVISNSEESEEKKPIKKIVKKRVIKVKQDNLDDIENKPKKITKARVVKNQLQKKKISQDESDE